MRGTRFLPARRASEGNRRGPSLARGRTGFGAWPVVAYWAVLLMCAVAWETERRALLAIHDPSSSFVSAMRRNHKEWVSLVLYAIAIGLALVNTAASCVLYCLVAAIWIVPDRRIEREMGTTNAP